jgi:hypothetical protein
MKTRLIAALAAVLVGAAAFATWDTSHTREPAAHRYPSAATPTGVTTGPNPTRLLVCSADQSSGAVC